MPTETAAAEQVFIRPDSLSSGLVTKPMFDDVTAGPTGAVAAEGTRLRALGEAEAIRATGGAKAQAYRAGVEALGAQGYTLMQLRQIVGERNVRIVPDVAVNGTGAGGGLVNRLLGAILQQ